MNYEISTVSPVDIIALRIFLCSCTKKERCGDCDGTVQV